MKLIADAGSTKVEWVVLASNGTVQATMETRGVNALMLTPDELRSEFTGLQNLADFSRIYYYGAGCVSEAVCAKVSAALPRCGHVEVHSDLLGAARALYDTESGLAAIVGTGSNTGLYDGERIVANMPPLGYVLGDEGGGASMGRQLLRAVYRSGLLRQEFEQWLGLDYAAVLNRVYAQPGANRFLASLVPFVAANRKVLSDVIQATFAPMMEQLRRYYGPEASSRLRLVGGVAAEFALELRGIACRFGIEITRTLKRPMEGLIEYHRKS